MKERKRPITDILLSDKEIAKLKKGYAVYKMRNNHIHCLRPAGKDRKVFRQIEKLKQQIKALKEGGTK